MQKIKFRLIQGDSKLFNLSFTRTGAALNITDWTILFQMTSGSLSILSKDITVHTDPENGMSQLYFSTAETTALLGAYDFTLKIRDDQEQVTSILYGVMNFIKV